jgi:hypothetical protein
MLSSRASLGSDAKKLVEEIACKIGALKVKNGRIRDELLNEHASDDLRRAICHLVRPTDYNRGRPHTKLNSLTPSESPDQIQTSKHP